MSEQKQAKSVKKAWSSLGTLYEYDYAKNVIKLKNKKCPRCGNIMAHHKAPIPRWTCGSCSYTDYMKEK